MVEVKIRATAAHDRDARAEVVRQAWEAAYSEIFTAREIASVFNGSTAMVGSWTNRRIREVATLVAELNGQVIGIAGAALLAEGDGELTALYVLPAFQGTGVGTQLWHGCCRELYDLGVGRMEVWTMARAAARRFYEARGCRPFGAGTFSIGSHSEDVVGYEAATSSS